MRTRSIATFLLLAVALAASATPAGATLPKPPTTKIVPGKSIGGVRLGMSLAQVRAAWGSGGVSEAGDACTDDGSRTSCIWTGGSVRERALVGFGDGEGVTRVTISGGSKSPLAKWRTARKLGIGSTTKTLLAKLGLGASRSVGLGAPLGATGAFLDHGAVYYVSRGGRVIAVGMSRG